MQCPPGFKSDAQRENFISAAKLHRRGGVLSPVCGARTRTGTICTQVPISEGKGRCQRHCGPGAARAHRETQLRQMQTGKTSPEEFARAEARRARNRLTNGWKKNPSLPGRTIDLGASEGPFVDAVRALGADVDALLPAVRDWLAWRFQRTQLDRTADETWTRAVRVDLPKRIADADASMVWVRLGNLDKRTKEGRAMKAALRAGGEPLAARLATTASRPALGEARGPLATPLKVWAAQPPEGPSRRILPDRNKIPNPARMSAPKPLGRPRRRPDTPDELAALMAVYWAADSAVQGMFQAIEGEADRLAFLRALKGVADAPDDPNAQRRWGHWYRALARA
ncbi:hypothetical protein [Pseudorhodobacter wandonensis]|uniref:hypothetical protein n=2 Tax=Pseudorhodobacter wandonensis TaxID=1120568 RepID=UPI000B13FEC6|nr:hypothetical protein [Pseudorhodobacter wandonensis]